MTARFSVTYHHGAESGMVANELTFRRALWYLSGPFEACPEGIAETAARHLPMADGTLTQRRTLVYSEGITFSSRARIARYLRVGLGSQAKPAPRPHGPVWDPYTLMPRGTPAASTQEQRSPRSAPRKTRRSVSATIEAPTSPPIRALPASGNGDLFG